MRALVLLLLAAAMEVNLPHRIVTLDNGLQLVMQPDPSMPTVGVEYWIRGGSREEVPGLYGIAHLFEHNVPSSGRFQSNAENRALRARTGRGSGAGTQPDFLRFYLTTTPEGVEAALAQLADRLESDYSKFTEEAVRRDQDIVVSELRRGGNIDWDMEVLNHLHRGTYGADHPYGHATSGNEHDVRNATAETMRDWHRRFSGASNAIVFVTGNFDPAKVEAMVRKHYGPIPPGIRAPRTSDAVPPARARRDVIEKDVTAPIVYLRWPIPGWGTAEGDYLTLVAHILRSRMKDATPSLELLELAGSFGLRGPDEAAMRKELERFLADGPAEAEVTRAKAVQQADFVRMLQRGVWRGSRADAIGMGLLFRNDPDGWRAQLARTANATAAQLHETARQWLAKPAYVLQVVPRPKRGATGTIDRAATVPAGEAVPLQFPKVERTSLPSGLPVLIARRPSLPLVQITVAYPEPPQSLADELTALGADVSTHTDADFTTVSASVLNTQLNDVLRVFARHPGEVLILSGDIRDVPPIDIPRAKTRAAAAPPPQPGRERFEVVDRPAATQVQIELRQILPPSVARDSIAADLVVHALRQRLMNNLRSDKGWSYEVYPFGVELRRGAAAARFIIPVKTDKTAEAISEVRKEIARLRDEPMPATELAGARSFTEVDLTPGLGSLAQLNIQLLEIARNDLAPDAYAQALARLQTITPEQLQAAARALLQPDQLHWIVTGPKDEVERELKELHEAR